MKWQMHSRHRFLDLYYQWVPHQRADVLENPLLHPDFMYTAIKHFGDDRTRILEGIDGSRPSFLLPVTRRALGKWQTFAPSQLPIAPIYDNRTNGQPIDIAGIFDALSRGTVMFEILNYDSDYAQKVLCGARQVERNRYGDTIVIDAHSDYSKYWDSRPKKLRSNMGRYSRRVANDGMDISLAIAESPADVQRALATYGEIECAGWKGRAGTAISKQNIQGRFYSEVLERFSERRNAAVFELKFNETTVASRIAISHDDVVAFLKTTYMEDYARFSPGRLLLQATIRHHLNSGRYRRLEFFTNANRDTLQWGSVSREITHLNVYRYEAIRRSKRLLSSIRRRFET